MELYVPKVLRYRESAQAVTRVVEISGSEDRVHHNGEHAGNRVNGICHESMCVCPDGVGLTCQAYPEGPLSGSDSTKGCTPARPAARTSIAADSAQTLLLRKEKVNKTEFKTMSLDLTTFWCADCNWWESLKSRIRKC